MNTDRSASAPTLSFADARAIEDEVTKVFLEYLHTMGDRGEGTQEQQGAMYHPDVTGFGTGAQERIMSREDMLALNQQEHEQLPQGLTVDVDWVNVYPLNAVAAMAEAEMQLVTTLPEGPPLTMPCRISVLWVLQDEAWLLRHGHLSFPSWDQAEEEVFPLDALRTRNQELERQVAERTAALEAAKIEVEEALANLKITQAQLIQQEKMASLGQLTAGIAHEIKNPLNFVNNFSELVVELTDELNDELDRDATLREVSDDVRMILGDLKQNAQVIAQHGKRADGIVQAMMQHTSGGSGQREATDLNRLVSEHIELAYHGRRGRSPTHVSKRAQVNGFNATIERNLSEAVGRVELVPQQIGQVVLNLLSNAFDAVHERAMQRDTDYAPTVKITTRRLENQVEVLIEDNGPGIPDEIKEKIFEPFFTTKPTGSGTGLGLSLSYDIVTQGHGGTLTVEGKEGEGATFIVQLPARHRLA